MEDLGINAGNKNETVYLPYSKDSVYSFNWQQGVYDGEIGLTVTVGDAEEPTYSHFDFSDIENEAVFFRLNYGNYTAVNDAIAAIPENLTGYTEDSVQTLQDAVNAVNWDLKPDQQEEIYHMADAIEDAINNLVSDSDVDAQGNINMNTVTADLYITESGYRWGAKGTETPYKGSYRLSGKSIQYRVIVESGSHKIKFFELYLTNKYNSPFAIQPDASVSLTLVGENELKQYDYDLNIVLPVYAGLNVPAGAELEITAQSKGSLLAFCREYGAGIGGNYGYSGIDDSIGTISGGIVNATGCKAERSNCGIYTNNGSVENGSLTLIGGEAEIMSCGLYAESGITMTSDSLLAQASNQAKAYGALALPTNRI